MKRIVCFHLYNDYSGSPKVLYNVLSGLLERGFFVELHTSEGGILDSLSGPNLKVCHYRYKFSPNPVMTMFHYTRVQLLTFFRALRHAFRKETVFYINTILPLGPALAGRMTGKRVVYHYHENAYIKSGFYRLLARGMQRTASWIICVSRYQASFLNRKKNVVVISNSLDSRFLSSVRPNPEDAFMRKTILMLASLKQYKGTDKFIRLASLLPQFHFRLVLNESVDAVSAWIDSIGMLPENIQIDSRISDVAAMYNKASVVLNLSDPSMVVETFGLTALEAMSCALPVIVPPVGGIAEMVEDGYNGYKIECNDIQNLKHRISQILTDKRLYTQLAQNALSTSSKFNRENMLDSLLKVINE